MVLLIDNYDSFVYNLARYVSELGYEKTVQRNDALTLAEIEQLHPSHIIISPGPRSPVDAGISVKVIQHFGSSIPILGICLGHQAIGQAYGGKIIRAIRPVHGRPSMITHHANGLFSGIENPLKVGRYHSLIVKREGLPTRLKITAVSPENEIMALAHETDPVYGVQFHPESVLTEQGHALLLNFLKIRR